jgi:hypothetical protein
MKLNIAPLAVLVWAAMQTTVSAQAMNVQSLINDGYKVAGVFTSKVGWPGVFLQKGNALVVCFVGEKPGSASIDTQYCKPVK